jgi:uncharacterized protein (UPF0335 family)
MTGETPSEVETVEGTGEAGGRVPLGARAHDELRSLVERRERLDDEIADLLADRRELMKEVKTQGFDLGWFRELLRRRRMGSRDWAELDEGAEIYATATGGLERGLVDGGELGVPALPAPQLKIASKMAEADAWADGAIG